MGIDKILSFLTHAGKNADEQTVISGAEIPKEGKLYNMLSRIFESSDSDCNVPIIFRPEAGEQKNTVKSEITKLIMHKSINEGMVLAERLQLATTKKSGMGLLFLIIGDSDGEGKIVISRFPADEGIVAERNSETLKVEFVEEVFLKGAYSYKSVMYKYNMSHPDLWTGFAIDKQLNSGAEVAAYWINDFLLSDFQSTPRAGTKRLAVALRDAISNSDDMQIKHDITLCAQLAKNIPNKAMSINEFCDQFHLSEVAKEAVRKEIKSTKLLQDKFVFDLPEFEKYISYKMVELDNGAVLSAQASKFDKCFEIQKTDKANDSTRFTTTGKIIDEKLRRSK